MRRRLVGMVRMERMQAVKVGMVRMERMQAVKVGMVRMERMQAVKIRAIERKKLLVSMRVKNVKVGTKAGCKRREKEKRKKGAG
jgi:hypothetical protein